MRRHLVLLLCLWPLCVSAQDQTPPIVTVEASPETVSVGQPVIVRVTVLVPTWLLSPPVFPSFEVPNVIARLPARASGPTSQRVNSETWSGVTRAYRMYPMVAGDFSLPAQEIEVTYADPDGSQPVTKTVALPPVRFTSEVPAGAEGLDPLIVAENLTMEQSFEGPKDKLSQGDAVVRTITAKITGSSPLFIPPLMPAVESDAVQVYPKDGRVTESEARGKLSGTRTDSATYVAQYGGQLVLPEVNRQWFNVDTGKVETATAKGRTYQVDAPARPREPLLSRQHWIALIGVVLLACVVLFVIRRYVWGSLVAWRQRRRQRFLESERYAARLVGQAMGSRDLSSTRNALAVWSMQLAPTGGAEDQELEASLLALGASRYSQKGVAKPDWRRLGDAFAAARKARKKAQEASLVDSVLPPMNPF